MSAMIAAAKSTMAQYVQLSKARLSAFVTLSAGGGMLLAGPPSSWAEVALLCGGTMMCASSAAALNQMMEKGPDSKMARTRSRPLPSGKMSMTHAAAFAAATGVGGVALLSELNPITAGLGLGNILLYSFVYTPMKRVSVWNTPVGAVVGAIPPVMGFVAGAHGSDIMPACDALLAAESAVGAGLLCAWQGYHFYSLAWMNRVDYKRGGHVMDSVVDPTGLRTSVLITGSILAAAAIPLGSLAAGVTGPLSTGVATAMHAGLLYQAVKFHGSRSTNDARKIFLWSLPALPLIMALMIADSRWWHQPNSAKDVEVDSSVLGALPAIAVSADSSSSGDGHGLPSGQQSPTDRGLGHDADVSSATSKDKDKDDVSATAKSKCLLGVKGKDDMCVHELVRHTHVTPSCSEVNHTISAAVADTPASMVAGTNRQ